METARALGRPRATVYSIEDLVGEIERGVFRIPVFQRPLRWGRKEVEALFDSIWRGFPVGSLLLWKRPAPANPGLRIGEIPVGAPAMTDALLVVDGQQRLVTLLNVLRHPRPSRSSADIYALWFDLDSQQFRRAAQGSDIPASWLPLNQVLDAVELGEWFEAYRHTGEEWREHYRTALQLAKSIREFQIPAYILDADDDRLPREVFTRLNTGGKEMREWEVFRALNFGTSQGDILKEAAAVLAQEGFGEIAEPWLVRCIRAVRGDDLSVGQDLAVDAYREAWPAALDALIRTVTFLRVDAGLPHLRLLPYRLPLVVLTRFFHLHPDPHPRNLALLSRWFWRGTWNGRHKDTQKPHLGTIHRDVDGDAGATIKRLLADVATASWPTADGIGTMATRPWFFGSAHSKLTGIVLAAQGPRDLRTGDPLAVGWEVESLGGAAFGGLGRQDTTSCVVLHPPDVRSPRHFATASDDVLHSHLLPPLPASTLGALFGSQVEDEDITLPPQWHQARTRLLVAATTRFMAAKAVLEGPDHGAWSDQMSDIPDEPDDSEG